MVPELFPIHPPIFEDSILFSGDRYVPSIARMFPVSSISPVSLMLGDPVRLPITPPIWFPPLTYPPFEVMVRDAYEIGKDDFPNSEVFAIGDAQIRDDDGYTLYFDNKDGRLFAREFDTNKTVEVSNSITEVIANMEALI